MVPFPTPSSVVTMKITAHIPGTRGNRTNFLYKKLPLQPLSRLPRRLAQEACLYFAIVGTHPMLKPLTWPMRGRETGGGGTVFLESLHRQIL